MEGLDFSNEQLLSYIRQRELSPNASITDLENPTGPFVQTIFFKILTDLGYSESMFNTNQPEFGVLEELGEHAGSISSILLLKQDQMPIGRGRKMPVTLSYFMFDWIGSWNYLVSRMYYCNKDCVNP